MRAFRQIGGLPLIIIVGLALDDIYAEWWRRAAWSIAVTSAVCLGILMLAWGFRRELRRRELAEQDLAELATALSGMAVTDPLTGLGNRRHFDALLQREWRPRRAIEVVGLASDDRHRSLQGVQRPLRPPAGRRGAAHPGESDQRLNAPAGGQRRALRRRRVRRGPAGHRFARRHGGCREYPGIARRRESSRPRCPRSALG